LKVLGKNKARDNQKGSEKVQRVRLEEWKGIL